MSVFNVVQLRAGAPDKFLLWSDDLINYVKRDNTNLVDLTNKELNEIYLNSQYVLPADEGDIIRANKFAKDCSNVPQNFILLPQYKDGTVINYIDYVPKDSQVYEKLEQNTGIKYMPYTVCPIDKFVIPSNGIYGIAFKTTTGSGSRGVILIDPDRIHLGGKYYKQSSDVNWDEFIKFAKSQPSYCKIMIQDLIPNKDTLTKVNVDFVIKNGELLGYKWDKTDPKAVFTNWNFGWFIRSKYTDEVMGKLANYLINECGVYNAIMNFEAFSDLQSETYLVEFNWRYSNSMFEGQALGIDLVSNYLNNKKFEVPFGEHKFTRYWQCALYKDIFN